jgi:hypothetical protein
VRARCDRREGQVCAGVVQRGQPATTLAAARTHCAPCPALPALRPRRREYSQLRRVLRADQRRTAVRRCGTASRVCARCVVSEPCLAVRAAVRVPLQVRERAALRPPPAAASSSGGAHSAARADPPASARGRSASSASPRPSTPPRADAAPAGRAPVRPLPLRLCAFPRCACAHVTRRVRCGYLSRVERNPARRGVPHLDWTQSEWCSVSGGRQRRRMAAPMATRTCARSVSRACAESLSCPAPSLSDTPGRHGVLCCTFHRLAGPHSSASR